MKNKIITLLSAFFLIVSLCGSLPAGAAAENGGDQVYDEAKYLVDRLTGATVFEKDGDEEITRAEFAAAVVKLLGISAPHPEEYAFADVASHYAYADEIYAALSLGWISDAERFNPNAAATQQEAVKIAVMALNRGALAEVKGGYPAGYLTAAKDAGLLKRMDTNSLMTARNGYILLFNMLKSNVYVQVSFGDEKRTYEEKDETVLHKLYEMDVIEGIVTATPYNSMIESSPEHPKNSIAINGRFFTYDDVNEDLLGYNCSVYYEDGVISHLFPKNNTLFSAAVRNADMPGKNAIYIEDADTGTGKSYPLDASYIVMYNGKLCPEVKSGCFDASSGYVHLLDNDADGRFDMIFVEAYQYMRVGNVDAKKLLIGGKNGADVLDLSDSGCRYSIYDYDSKSAVGLDDIKQGDAIAVAASEDKKLVKIIKYTTIIRGRISEIDSARGIAMIDSNQYYFSDYFKKNAAHLMRIGTDGVFYIGENNDLVDIHENISGFRYGYLLGAASDGPGLARAVKLKIFSEDGIMQTLEVAENPTVDGQKVKKGFSEYLEKNSHAFSEPQLIRYLTVNDKITKIDLSDVSTDTAPVSYSDVRPDDDSLTRYSFANYRYSASGMGFVPYFSVEMAKVFYVPADLDDKKFAVKMGNDIFSNGKNYTSAGDVILPYDIDKTGCAAAIVYKDMGRSIYYQSSKTNFVEKVVDGLNRKGEDAKLLYTWEGGVQKKYAVSEDVSLIKPSGKPLACGDIITVFAPDKELVVELNVDFDSDPAVFAPGEFVSFNSDIQVSGIMFYGGGAYAAGGNYLVLSSAADDAGNPVFTSDKLRVFYLNSNSLKSIMVYDTARKKLRKGSISDVKTHLAYGDDASRIVLRQSSGLASAIMIYE